MKFTSEDLIKAMKLSIGDRIKMRGRYYNIELSEISGLPVYATDKRYYNIKELIDQDIEIISKSKRVGDLTPETCERCSLKLICSALKCKRNQTQYELLENFKKYYLFDQEIYDLLKARLDKEMK